MSIMSRFPVWFNRLFRTNRAKSNRKITTASRLLNSRPASHRSRQWRQKLGRPSATTIVAVAMLGAQVSPAVAKTVAGAVWSEAEEAASTVIREARSRLARAGRDSAKQQNASAADRAAAADHFRLCPRHLKLYVGEGFNLVPLPLANHE